MFFPREVCREQVTRFLLVLGIVLSSSGTSALATDPYWGAKMFDVTEIKFGSVAKGADSVVQVRVKNIYKENIEVTNATTGCGCVSWDEARESRFPLVIPSGQTRVLNLRLDTIRYDGERKSKATISLFDPVHSVATQVELPVEGYIRRDIVLTPGAVNFGTIDFGAAAERKVEIRYAGRSDWKLMQPKVSNPHLAVTLNETSRANNGLVNYELLVTLKPEAPLGGLRDQITMVTDDANNPQIAVLVEARIEPDIVITDLQFGSIAPGQSKQIPVIVRGKKPFKIEELYREDKNNGALKDAFTVKKLEKAISTVHSLPITINAPEVPGVFEEEFFVKIADRPQPISFKARGRILEPAGGAAKN
jgi:hypothetical protein